MTGRLLPGALAGLLCALPSARAATNTVIVGNNFFNPANLTNNVNDTVLWTWNGNNHTTTSTSGLWNSGIRNAGATFSFQFASAGTFPYRCTVHAGQNGTITVRAPNTPPVVTITNPVSGTVFAAPASFLLAASASDPGGSVTNVQFFRDATSLGNDSASPYAVSVTNLAAGDFLLSAVASDNLGARATSAVPVSVVTPVPIHLAESRRSSPTQFVFSYTANVGLRYQVQRAPRLGSWSVLRNDSATTNRMTVRDDNATNQMNLYRVLLLPNP